MGPCRLVAMTNVDMLMYEKQDVTVAVVDVNSEANVTKKLILRSEG